MNPDDQDERQRDLAQRIARIRACDYSFEGLLLRAAQAERGEAFFEDVCEQQSKLLDVLQATLSYVSEFLPPLLAKEVAAKIAEAKSSSARDAINERHSKPGGSREKRRELLDAWASGQYKTKDDCAEDCSRYLGMNLSTARRALQGTSDPNPWPAKNTEK